MVGDRGGGEERRTLWGYWSKRPIATLLFAAVIVVSLRSIPSINSAEPPGAPQAVSPGGKLFVPIPMATLVKRGGTIMAIDPGTEQKWDVHLGAAQFDYRLRPEFEGRYISLLGVVNEADVPEARAAYTVWLTQRPEKYWQNVAARMQAGDQINFMGYKVKRAGLILLSLVCAGLWVRSLAWAAPMVKRVLEPVNNLTLDPEERERRRRAHALKAGKCPGCGYSIIGLPKRRCPECNETWSEAEFNR